MGRVYNFSAGPAVLPEEVLKEAADEMLDYRGTGMSVMPLCPLRAKHLKRGKSLKLTLLFGNGRLRQKNKAGEQRRKC